METLHETYDIRQFASPNMDALTRILNGGLYSVQIMLPANGEAEALSGEPFPEGYKSFIVILQRTGVRENPAEDTADMQVLAWYAAPEAAFPKVSDAIGMIWSHAAKNNWLPDSINEVELEAYRIGSSVTDGALVTRQNWANENDLRAYIEKKVEWVIV